MAGRTGHAREEPRHLADLLLEPVRRRSARFRARPRLAGLQTRRQTSVVGDNRPRLYCAMLGAMALGGMAVPVYQDSIASELVFVLEHAEVSVIVAEDQEQVDKILSLRDQLPNLKLIVFDDPRGLSRNPDPAPEVVRGCSGQGPRIRQIPSRFLRARTRGRARRRDRADRLYVGHDGPSQGRAPEPLGHGRDGRKLPEGRGRQEGRQLAGLPADGLGRRHHVDARRGAGGRRRHQLPGKSRDRHARSARTRSRRHHRAAAHLGEPDAVAPDQIGRCLAAQAADVRVLQELCRRARVGGLGRQGGSLAV